MTTLIWPQQLLYAETVDWGLASGSIDGGTTITNVRQVGFFGGGPSWTLNLDGLVIDGVDALAAAAVLQAEMDGGATPVIVGPCDCWFAPLLPDSAGVLVPHSDGTPFSDGTEYISSPIIASLAEAAANRAYSVKLNIEGARPLRGREHFSITHPTAGRRMYRVLRVIGGTDEAPEVTIRPLLREAVAGGEEADFYRPSCLMRLVDENAFPLPVVHGLYAETSARFEEWDGDAP